MSSIVYGCIVPHPPIMVPEVGRDEASLVNNTARGIRLVAEKLAAVRPDTIVVISPHGPMVRQSMGIVAAPFSRGDLAAFGAPAVAMTFHNDNDFMEALSFETEKRKVPLVKIAAMENIYQLDHGVVAPFSFLVGAINNATVVPLVFSLLSRPTHYLFGEAIKAAAERINKRVAVIASADLSHRLTSGSPAGYDSMGAILDKAIIDAVEHFDAESLIDLDQDMVERGGECGLRSIIILFGALHGLNVRPEILSYEGPFGVGYMVASCEVRAMDQSETQIESHDGKKVTRNIEGQLTLVHLARQAVEGYVLEHQYIAVPSALTSAMKEKAGVFVCLKKKGHLRGCIGTFEPTRSNVAEEIIHNSISSATQDPRFPRVSADELSSLTYTVDVLTTPEPVSDVTCLDTKRFGIIVENGHRRGLLLPDLEGVDSAEEQVSIAKEKAGISPEEPVKMYRFEVRRYEE